MEVLLRILAILITSVANLLRIIFDLILQRIEPTYPPIRKRILTKSVRDLVHELRRKEVTSVELVSEYIKRIREVNPSLNAVVEDRYAEALKEAQHADELISKTKNEFELLQLYTQYPLLGIPFTIKEACGLKGMSFSVGSMVRKVVKSPTDGEVVENLRAAGCIPLLVSANPEFCYSFETNPHNHGKCLNPYDLHRVSGGSSGGEGALNGAGASLFGLGSDISGSIRLPAMFCGVFGHKPTGGLTSVKGHFPNTKIDPDFEIYLQEGPITRFARDMPLLLEIMAGENRKLLKMDEKVPLREIKIHYAYGFSGFNGFTRPQVDASFKMAITQAVKCFEQINMETELLRLDFLRNSLEIVVTALVSVKGIPSVITQNSQRGPSMKMLLIELFNSLIGHSLFTKDALVIEIMKRLNCSLSASSMALYREETKKIKIHLTNLLGTRGVLLLPTFHTSALHFNTTMLNVCGVDIMLLFNVLGFPATHVPMGLDKRGLPIGIQVIAAPYQDKLCLQIAAELEGAYGGWVPPIPHELED